MHKLIKIFVVFAVLVAGIVIYSLPETPKEKPPFVAAEKTTPPPEAKAEPPSEAKAEPLPEVKTAPPPAETIPEEKQASEPAPPALTNLTPGHAAPAVEDKSACPAVWSLKPGVRNVTAQEIIKAGPMTADGDKALLGPEDAGLQPAVQGLISGGSIRFVIPGGSYLNIDGRHIVGVENFSVDHSDGKSGVINVLAPGLATMRGKDLTIIDRVRGPGDKELPGSDVIYLDGCLQWDGPREVTHNDEKPYQRYTAEDGQGHYAFVDIFGGADVRFLPPARIKAWAEAQAKH